MEDHPIVNAASNADLSILQEALYHERSFPDRTVIHNKYWYEKECTASAHTELLLEGTWTSALLEAVIANLHHNVDFLLSEGTDPDGLPLYIFDNSSTFYLRGDSNRPPITMFMVRKPRSEMIRQLNVLQEAVQIL